MEMHQIRYFLAVCGQPETSPAPLKPATSLSRAHPHRPEAEEELIPDVPPRAQPDPLDDFGKLKCARISSRFQRTPSRQQRPLRGCSAAEEAPSAARRDVTVGPTRCIGLLAQFNKENPGVDVTLSEGVPEASTESLLAGELDIPSWPNQKDWMAGSRSTRSIESVSLSRFRPGHRSHT